MKKFLITVIACILASAWSQGATIYDWKNDWQGTGTQPDNGVWYYKGCAWNETATSTYGAMNWDTGNMHWYYGDAGWWYYISKGNMDSFANNWDILAWKAPATAAAIVAMKGSVGGWGNTTLSLQVLNNAGAPMKDIVLNNGETFDFSVSDLSVNTGDYLYVRVKTNNNGQYLNTTFDTLTITLVPEPASLALLALGGILAVVRPRRRN